MKTFAEKLAVAITDGVGVKFTLGVLFWFDRGDPQSGRVTGYRCGRPDSEDCTGVGDTVEAALDDWLTKIREARLKTAEDLEKRAAQYLEQARKAREAAGEPVGTIMGTSSFLGWTYKETP